MICQVCSENHPTYMCCDRCNYDTHDCPGCGEWVGHDRIMCDECNDGGTNDDSDTPAPA
jgi:hypothetical protein